MGYENKIFLLDSGCPGLTAVLCLSFLPVKVHIGKGLASPDFKQRQQVQKAG